MVIYKIIKAILLLCTLSSPLLIMLMLDCISTYAQATIKTTIEVGFGGIRIEALIAEKSNPSPLE